jgi:inorganic pyrophosphatase
MSKEKSFHPWRPHPWHGITPGRQPPEFVYAYIEITPFDAIKYEIDKDTGYLKVDRPQLTSSLPPSLYGFVPQTYCGKKVASLAGPKVKKGDGDPLDILVLSERSINRSEVLVPCRVIGGLRMIDRGEADDKIIAVLDNDPTLSQTLELEDLPPTLLQRLTHYFTTYKLVPGQTNPAKIDASYNRKHAFKVIEASLEDYKNEFGLLPQLKQNL